MYAEILTTLNINNDLAIIKNCVFSWYKMCLFKKNNLSFLTTFLEQSIVYFPLN